ARERREVDRLEVELVGPCEAEEAFQDLLAAEGLLLDDAKAVRKVAWHALDFTQTLADLLGVARDRGERVVDLVRDVRGEAAEVPDRDRPDEEEGRRPDEERGDAVGRELPLRVGERALDVEDGLGGAVVRAPGVEVHGRDVAEVAADLEEPGLGARLEARLR